MVLDENRSAAAIKAVSTGSAGQCRSQPGLGRSRPIQKKTLGPGALDRGFLCAFVTLDRAAGLRFGQQGGNPPQAALSGSEIGQFALRCHEQSRADCRKLSHLTHGPRPAVAPYRRVPFVLFQQS